MQAEDAERNPSNWMSREIAVKVNNELQQPPPPNSPPASVIIVIIILASSRASRNVLSITKGAG